MSKIKKIVARQILDSRGWPTIEVVIDLERRGRVSASMPSGKSVGKFEALELRDGNKNFYFGKSVLNAVENINKKIAPIFIDKPPDFFSADKIMLDLDGTKNKSNLGANSILAVSMAMLRAEAKSLNLEPVLFLKKICSTASIKPPLLMFNILNGGLHANNGLCFQEFMIVPQESCFEKALEIGVVVYQKLKELLGRSGYSTTLGDEGGFAPSFDTKNDYAEKIGLDYLIESIISSGYSPGDDVLLAIDVAASEFYDEKKSKYLFHNKWLDSNELVGLYKSLIRQYPFYSIEDGLYQSDWSGWKFMTKELSFETKIIGDDLFATNPDRIKKGILFGVANSVLIKPNQIGTVSETLEAIDVVEKAGYDVVVSHRSGETNDSFIVDLALGSGANALKAGAPARGERVEKYNRLIELACLFK